MIKTIKLAPSKQSESTKITKQKFQLIIVHNYCDMFDIHSPNMSQVENGLSQYDNLTQLL